MSIFTDVKDLAEGKKKSKDWYRSQVMYGLDPYTGTFEVGDIIFFAYSAATEKLQYYDRFPMVQIGDQDVKNHQFSGGNVHYLRPSARRSICNQWAVGSPAYPARCHHKYFMSNATNVYTVKPIDLQNMTPLPLEQFMFNAAGRWMEVPSSFIWSRS
jgi:hypothetical protein